MLEIGSVLDGKYKILNKVGQGGMSVVYLAMNEKANKQWAVKEVRKDGIKDFEVVKQGLVAETDILKKLNHPNLPSIIDVIDTQDSFIIIMDYIQGNALDKALKEFGAQPQESVIDWAKQLCDVLGYLHSRTPAIIYRDMKPSNVMLKPDGNVTLIDFGTAREFKEKNLADTTCLGTVGYAAPEQFGGMGQTDARTDIYCLGATLYHLVTGMNPCEPPYEIKPIREINPALSSGLERIILKCTQRDPNDRYQSAAELMYALEHYEEIDDLYRKKQKKKLNSFITTAVLTVVFGATSIWGYNAKEAEKKANYDVIIKTAESTAEYHKAILTDPTRPEAYLGLCDLLSSDYNLSTEDVNELRQLQLGLSDGNKNNTKNIDVLQQLKDANPDAYNEVCFEFGWNVLSWYNQKQQLSDESRYKTASGWFELMMNSESENSSIAKLFCDVYEVVKELNLLQEADTSKVIQLEDSNAVRQKMWEHMLALKDSLKDYDQVYQVQAWKEINGLTNTYVKQILAIVSPEEVVEMLEDVQAQVEQTDSSNPDIQNIVDELKTSIPETLKRVKSAM